MRTIGTVVMLGLASGAILEKPAQAAAPARVNLTDKLLDRFIVVPEHKLLFCYIEKVGCMNFNDLFRHVRAKYDPSQLTTGMWYRNSPIMHNFAKADLERVMADDSWHKAVFWRNPIERFTSGFQSKCGHANEDGVEHCVAQFGLPELDFDSAVTFMGRADYMAHLKGKGSVASDSHDDVHFKRMGTFCGGLRHTLEYYQTVEELDEKTSNAKVRKLLTTVGVNPDHVETLDALFPPPGHHMRIVSDDEAGLDHHHNTDASATMAKLFPESQPWLKSTLINHYKSDFELFVGGSSAKLFEETAPTEWKWPLEDATWEPAASIPPAVGV